MTDKELCQAILDVCGVPYRSYYDGRVLGDLGWAMQFRDGSLWSYHAAFGERAHWWRGDADDVAKSSAVADAEAVPRGME